MKNSVQDLDREVMINRVAKMGYGKVGAKKLLEEVLRDFTTENNRAKALAYYGFITKAQATKIQLNALKSVSTTEGN